MMNEVIAIGDCVRQYGCQDTGTVVGFHAASALVEWDEDERKVAEMHPRILLTHARQDEGPSSAAMLAARKLEHPTIKVRP